MGDGPLFDDLPDVWDLFSCGRYEQDLEIVEQARALARRPRSICSIAAGVREFASSVDDADGTYGIAQWFPGSTARPETGPTEREFIAAYRSRRGRNARLPRGAGRGRGFDRDALR